MVGLGLMQGSRGLKPESCSDVVWASLSLSVVSEARPNFVGSLAFDIFDIFDIFDKPRLAPLAPWLLALGSSSDDI